jgi:hypothetical protein
MLVDGAGVPLSLVVTGATWHDVSPLEPLRDAFVITRPDIHVIGKTRGKVQIVQHHNDSAPLFPVQLVEQF